MQRVQLDTEEKISRKEYLKRKRKSSRLLRKRSKITYMLLACFMALGVYIIIQFAIYRKYNNFKYTVGDGVEDQAIYSILFVTEGYTYDPVYSVSTILSSGKNEESILPSSNIEKINVNENYIYGIKNGTLCQISRDTYEILELVSDDVQNYVVYGDYIFYTATSDEILKQYNLLSGQVVEFNASNVKQIITTNDYVLALVYNSEKKVLFRFDYDGQNKARVTGDKEVSYAIEDNGIVYFVNKGDNNIIYKVQINGEGMTKVADIKCKIDIDAENYQEYMFCKENTLYYINSDDSNALWAYNMDTGENERILSANIEILQNIDNVVFYKINKESGVYLYNYETKFMSLVTKRRVKEFVIDPYAGILKEIEEYL